MFSLEALSAKHGDALLLHYGKGSQRSLIVIDGGPPGVYRLSLRERLDQLKRTLATPLPIRLVMVSHLDSDHIAGVLDLFSDLHKARESGADLAYDVATLWMNSFKGGFSYTKLLQPAERTSGVSLQSVGDGVAPRGLHLHAETLADLASVGQGMKLQSLARALGTDTNSPFPHLVMTDAGGPTTVPLGGGLSFRVVAPNANRLERLRQEWETRTAGKKVSPAELAAYVDNSVFNLSSIVVLATFEKKRMLLTGDARGDDIVEGLDAAKLLRKGRLHVDLLKVPHHGSVRNVAETFFENVTADHYVVSADGRHGNPDVETLKMITTARGSDKYTLWFTNKVAHCDRYLASDMKKHRNYKVVYRRKNELSVEVILV